MTSDVRFPVIRSLKVSNYPMYPGAIDGTGFNAEILPGTTVVVGTNGIGKTTLLHMLLFMLTGPFQPIKADLLRPGSGRHKRTKLSGFDYFSTRVGSPIEDATATLELQFGPSEHVFVTRSLANLSITELRHNRTVLLHPDEDRFLQLIEEVSNLSSPWDFDFLVRHMVFFLEEKTPLLWSGEGQFELLRILFLDRNLSEKCVALSDEIFKLDSRIRNKDWQLGDARSELQRLDERAKEESGDDDLVATQTRLLSIADELITHDDLASDLVRKLDNLEKESFEVEQRLDDARLSLRRVEQRYFSHAFPRLPETTALTFGRLLAEDACLVCGSEATQARARLVRLQKNHSCPVCETPQVIDEDATNVASLTKVQLAKLELDVLKLMTEHQLTLDLLNEVRGNLEHVKREQRESWREKVQLESKVEDLKAQLPSGNHTLEALRAQLDKDERQLKQDRNSSNLKRNQYAALLAKAHTRIAEVATSISKHFKIFAGKFLEEECSLEFEMSRRRVGQAGIFLEFPSFTVKMASATSTALRVRDHASQVSESQKEFLDLAFRMAVMRTAVGHNSPSMLVVETPEASLDTFFVERAGSMLREFTYQGKTVQHTVLASSNLNRENMVRALLGLDMPKNRATPKTEISKRLINLLDIAAKPTALKNHLPIYREQLEKAIHVD